MNESLNNLGCKKTRKSFATLLNRQTSDEATRLLHQHLAACARCAQEYRLLSLQRTVLDLSAAPETYTPDRDFFVAVRARIARGPEQPAAAPASGEDFWTTSLWSTARQLIPAMAMLLLLMIGATLMWSRNTPNQDPAFEAQYGIRGMTADDMLDTLVAEERINGR